MIYLRSAIYLLGQMLSALVILLVLLAVMPFSRQLRDRVISSWATFNMWTLRVVCGLDFRLRGKENLPADRAAIVLANHQSAWETLCFQLLLPPISFVLKRQLLWIPVFGWGLAAYQPIAIDRNRKMRALDQLIRQGKQRLEEGRWLVIYPEGTRMALNQPGKFQAGGAMIAAQSGAPVVPIAHNAGLFWPRKGFVKYPGTVDIVVGPLIETEGRKARQINQEAEQWIKQTLAELPKTRIAER